MTLLPLIAATYFIVSGGPFGLEDIVATAGYRDAIVILLLTPLLWSLPTAFMVAELAAALPVDGGSYQWVRRAMGPFWGFQEAWLTLVGSVFDMAIYPTLFVSYLGHFAPDITADGRGYWVAVAMVAACAAWNLLGAKAVGTSSVLLGIVLLSPFAILTGYAAFHRVVAPSPATPHHTDLLAGIMVAMWNYMGWDNTSTIAGEVDRPQRTYPLAMFGAVALVTSTYVVPIGAVWVTGLGAEQWTTGGWAEVARKVFGGEVLATAITIGGLIGAAGTMNGLTMSLARLPAALATDGFLPAVFARRTVGSGAPWVSIVACAAIWALALKLSFTKLIVLDVLLTGLSIILEFVALIALRIREPQLPRPFSIPGGLTGVIALSLPPTALLMATLARTDAEPVGPLNALQLGLILIAVGVAIYFAKRYGTQTA